MDIKYSIGAGSLVKPTGLRMHSKKVQQRPEIQKADRWFRQIAELRSGLFLFCRVGRLCVHAL
jgi:hypothetical protein